MIKNKIFIQVEKPIEKHHTAKPLDVNRTQTSHDCDKRLSPKRHRSCDVTELDRTPCSYHAEVGKILKIFTPIITDFISNSLSTGHSIGDYSFSKHN